MAETADILTSDDQNIILLIGTGCSMADMAKFVDVRNSWSQINVLKENLILSQ